jgi:hypothetical protein
VEKKEMTRLVHTMNEDKDNKSEMEELARDLRVQFKQPSGSTFQHNKKSKGLKEAEEYANSVYTPDKLRKILAATGTFKMRNDSPPPELWFGMIGRKEAKWITSDPKEANKAASKSYCRIHQVFHTQDKA